MELWFSEAGTEHVKLSVRVDRQLYSGRSDFQRIDVFESQEFGRFLALDGYIMLTERDEFIYHEMIVHPAMAVHSAVKTVLLIGAGDGGAARELARYPSVERIDVVEIDETVVRVCKEFLPRTACGFDDPRVRLFFQDGLEYVSACSEEYDLIIVDSTDPVGPGEGLFTGEFYNSCRGALSPDGIMINQHESPFYEADAIAMQRAHRRIRECFPVSRVYQAHIPTYPSGHWLFGFASAERHPLRDLNERAWNALGLKTRYYNTGLHRGAFALPGYVLELLRGVK